MKITTPRSELKKKDAAVHEVSCMDCKMVYIGETERYVCKWLTKHKAAVMRGDRKNGIVRSICLVCTLHVET